MKTEAHNKKNAFLHKLCKIDIQDGHHNIKYKLFLVRSSQKKYSREKCAIQYLVKLHVSLLHEFTELIYIVQLKQNKTRLREHNLYLIIKSERS